MHVERTIKIDQESLRKATVLARDAIAHYQKIKHPGYKRFDMNDDFQKEKALK